MSIQILILYDTQDGNTEKMARAVARGVESVPKGESSIRCVLPVSPDTQKSLPQVPSTGAPYAALSDLQNIDGLIIGSPTHFGNMSASLKFFLDQTSSDWMKGTLSDKPAGVFTSTGSLHGGMEATLLSMLVPLLHHGMVLCGLPYSAPALMQTQSGGTPYGASHWSTENGTRAPDHDELALCKLLGARVTTVAGRLKHE